ncbi:MAG: ABC transporter substrate-binding protein [Lachnospiraceae bacterium]|nr:ABC transporter substrate-binding protein [Lachnospiraceae bacterium]
MTGKWCKFGQNKLIIAEFIAIILVVIFSLFLFLKTEKNSTDHEDEKNTTSENAEIPYHEEGALYVGYDGDLGSLDITRNYSSYVVAYNVYDRLFEIKKEDNGEFSLISNILKNYTVSADKRTYNFELKDGIKFSNGDILSSEDVEFTFIRSIKADSGNKLADAIEGADDFIANKTDKLSGFKVYDEKRFSITLKKPFPSYLWQLTLPAYSILNKESVEEGDSLFGKDAEFSIGSGAYCIDKWNDEEKILKLNPNYWGEEPSVKKVYLKRYIPIRMDLAFRTGEIDYLVMEDFNKEIYRKYYTNNKEYRFIYTDCLDNCMLIMNSDKPLLSDKRVRRAIQLGIDRQAIIEEALDGNAVSVDGIFPKGLMGYTEDNQGWLKYDPEEAKKLINEVGDCSDFKLEIGITPNLGIKGVQKISNMIAEDLKNIGLRVSVVRYDADSRIYLRSNNKLTLSYVHWVADTNDPDNFLFDFFSSPEKAHNFSLGTIDENIMKRVVEARYIVNDEERLKEYASIEKKLVEEDAVLLPIYSEKRIFVIGNRIKNLTPSWSGASSIRFRDIELK